MISDDLQVISVFFFQVIIGENIVEEIELIMGTSANGVHPSLYSIEITCYHLWFLEYKLNRVNSVQYGHSWWILYIFLCIYFDMKMLFQQLRK